MYTSHTDSNEADLQSATGGRTGSAAALAHDQILPNLPLPKFSWSALRERLSGRIAGLDLAPDLAQNIGSPRWFRGAATFLSLTAVALAFWPDFSPVEAAPAVRLTDQARDEFRSQTIQPLALGGDTGNHMAATALVRPLANAPERPQLETTATFGRSDNLARVLARQGVGKADATRAAELVAQAIELDQIEPGTQIDVPELFARQLATC